MSYLELPAAPLPNSNRMIISFWFRDVSKQEARPRARIDWPQGFWKNENASETMVPPNAQYTFGGYDPTYINCIDFYNPYGLPLGGSFFGNAFMGPACVWIPNPPPMPLNTMELKKEGDFISPSSMFGDALTMMSEYGVRILLAFGDPGIVYNYCEWRVETPDVIPAVKYTTAGIPAEFLWWMQTPPYTPHSLLIGDNGKFHVRNFRCGDPKPKGTVPPCFIGIDDYGHLFINLQTNTTATYKGMAFECVKTENMWFWAAAGKPPPAGLDDHSFIHYGPFWNGYQFHHVDISQKMMGCASESFVIRGQEPVITDGGWHHVLFSFDISGGVNVKHNNVNDISVSSSCKAWLAFDDKNITGNGLQTKPKVHEGLTLPHLVGTTTTDLFDWGPCTSMARPSVLGTNGILPRNAWLKGISGLPRDGCQWFIANTPRIMDNGFILNLIVGSPNVGEMINLDDIAMKYGGVWGDFNWFFWTNRMWMLTYGEEGPPLKAEFDPMHPDPDGDPSKFDPPIYNCSGYTIPLAGHPISIPAGSARIGIKEQAPLSDYNTGIEVAELQIWCGKTLDTSVEDLRRLFLRKKKDQDGNDTGPFLPTPPKVAAETLGRPDVLLHRSHNWKKGKNTGTSGENAMGGVNPLGQFQPVATIETFLPDPKLGQ